MSDSTMPERSKIKRHFRVMKIIWLAIAASCGMFMVMIWLLSQEWDGAISGGPNQQIIYVLYGVALVTVGMSTVVGGLSRNVDWLLRPAPGQNEADRDPGARFQLASGRFFVTRIIAWAMTESAALFGVIGSILTQNTLHCFVLGSFAMAAILLIHAPKEKHLFAVYDQVLQSR